MMTRVHAALFWLLPLLVSCRGVPTHPMLTPSEASPVTDYSSFEQYVAKTEQLLTRHRYFLTSDTQTEITANLPFERSADKVLQPTRGVLLIHGLGDSPWSFVDIAESLSQHGFLVRTLLLSGHGTRPADMLVADHDSWQQEVHRQVALLKADVGEVYLGGFSTGGNLAYLEAAADPVIKGLMLFSPGFESGQSLARFAPLLSRFTPWLFVPNPDRLTNYTRYASMPTNGFSQYYKTSTKAMSSLSREKFRRPVFIALSEHDSVLDSAEIQRLFVENFTHPQSRLIWFGTSPPGLADERTLYIDSKLPSLRISNMSHMGILFSPDNPYYGINGSERICHNGQELEGASDYCRSGGEVWYSAWGHNESGKVHARLTLNPYFKTMMKEVRSTFTF
ncbi:alpha/beta hydrolase [Microbulbifer sp. 2201CG32-9]|uniref:alpha/beta hydrolase n=1 Tax=Microbulbifer sp. 2201CG32-9 TaxID=3232309 RepID=UPI00345B7C69